MAHSSSFYAQDIPVQQLKTPPLPSDAPPLPPRRKTEVQRVPPTRKHSSSFHERSERKPIESTQEIPSQKPRMRIVPRRPAPPIPPPKPKVMTLQEFACIYSNQLPLSVTAQAGYYGKNSNMQISVGETFSIHLMKTADVVVAAKGNEKYSIPLNSSCQFSLIYNPHNNMSEALQGYFFNGVMKLASADPLPKVVCPLVAWKKGNLTIETSEILVVRGINSNAELEVFSVTSSLTKLLPFNCQSKFTTDPHLLYMYLLDIVDNIPGAFPCQALLQDTNGDKRMLFSGSQHLKLVKLASEATLLCSYPGTNECFELPVDLPNVTVAICQYDDEALKLQLYESTKHIVSDYNPAYGTCCRDDVAKDVYETQTKIYASIREGYESIGVKLKISQEILTQMEGASQSKQEQLGEEDIQELVKPNSAPLQTDIRDGDCTEQVKKRNKIFLSSLSEEMVINVLHSMGLQRYEGNFQGITGAAMCELTEEKLGQLGVKSKLHQIRLMKIVDGEKDVRSI